VPGGPLTVCGIARTIETVAGRALAAVRLINDAQTHRGPIVIGTRLGDLRIRHEQLYHSQHIGGRSRSSS